MNNNYNAKLEKVQEFFNQGFELIPVKYAEKKGKFVPFTKDWNSLDWNFELFKKETENLTDWSCAVKCQYITSKNAYLYCLDFDCDELVKKSKIGESVATKIVDKLSETSKKLFETDEKYEKFMSGIEFTLSQRVHFFFYCNEELSDKKIEAVLNWAKKKDGSDGKVELIAENIITLYDYFLNDKENSVLERDLPVLSKLQAEKLLEKFGIRLKEDKKTLNLTKTNNTNQNAYEKIKAVIENLRNISKKGYITGYDFDTSIISYLVDNKATDEQIYELAKEFYQSEYEEKTTSYMIQRAKQLDEKIGIGTFIEKIKQYQDDEDVKAIINALRPEKQKIEINEGYFETEKAFYSSVFAYNKNKRKRYAFLKNENELWEVIEEINAFVDEKKYLQDNATAFETILINKNEIMNEVRYSYIAIYKEKQIANFNILSGTEHTDELTTEIQYTLNIITKNKKSIKIENIITEDLINKLKADNLITSNQKIRDAIGKTLPDLIEAGVIKQEQGISKSGFFLKDNKIILSKLELKEVDKEKLRQALLFTNELVEKHFSHTKEKFATIIKYFVIAPFSFISRQQKKMIKSLYLYGASGVGKSTMAVISASIWGNFQRVMEKTGTTIDTVARLGNVLSNSTFTEIISEPQGALTKEEVIEALKNGLTGTIARGKFIMGQYREIPALANFVFTSNHFVPQDDALLRRFYIISFSRSERPDRNNDFIEARKMAEELLPEIGNYIAFLLKENDGYITNQILQLNEDNFFDISKNILEYVYKKSELEVPSWINYLAKEDYNLQQHEDEEKLDILLNLKEMIIKELNSMRFAEEISMRERLEIALREQKISFLMLKNNKVILTREVLSRLKIKIASLKLLSELMGWEYVEKYSIKLSSNSNKTTTIRAIVFSLQEFIELIFPNEEQEEHQTEEGNQEQQTETETEQSKQQKITTRDNVINESIEKAILSITDKILKAKSKGLTSFEYFDLLRSYRIDSNIAVRFFEYDGTLFRIKLSDEVKNLALKHNRNDILKYIDKNTIDF